MKKMKNYDDYLLDLIVESIVSEAPLLFSDRFINLISEIKHPISDYLIQNYNKPGYKSTYIDLDDSGLDKVSFITTSKAVEIISTYNNIDKEDFSNLNNNTNLVFNNVMYNNTLRDLIYSKFRSTTSIGKLIGKLFPGKFQPALVKDKDGNYTNEGQDVQSFVDKFKSLRDTAQLKLVHGDDIVKWYLRDNYINGEDTNGSLGGSCMRFQSCQQYVQFYADNKDKVSLLILPTKNEDGEDKIKGRALVWKLSKPEGRTFMDRIYTVNVYDEELFKSYAKEKGWLYKAYQNSGIEEIVDTKDDSKSYLKLEVDNIVPSSTDYYPYVDTLKYYSEDEGILSSDEDRFSGEEHYDLSNTGGQRTEVQNNDDRVWVEFYEEYFDEDDITYCELGDEYRTHDDAVWLPYYNQCATEQYLDTYMVQCDYGKGHGYELYRKDGDYVELYGTKETATTEYTEENLTYSNYHYDWLPPGKEVWSEYHQDYIYEPEAVKVYLDETQTEHDWRADDDDTWWEWDHDGEKYDNDVSLKDLKEYNDIIDEEIQDDEDK